MTDMAGGQGGDSVWRSLKQHPGVTAAVVLIVILGTFWLTHAYDVRDVAAPATDETTHAFPVNMKVSIDPKTHWQPRSGEVLVNLQGANTAIDLSQSLITAHFRWSARSNSGEWVQTPNLHLVDAQNPQKLVVAVQVPEMPPAPSYPFQGLVGGNPDGLRAFLGLVPIADVWVTGSKRNGGPDDWVIDEVRTIGITTSVVAWVAAGAAVAVLIIFLRSVRPRTLQGSNIMLQLIETRGGRASLSQFQILLWTLVIGAATAYVMALSGNLIPLTEGTLALLGISGVATVSSQLAQAPTRAIKLPKGLAAGVAPHWRDLVAVDGNIEITRVQMLFFTVLMAIFVIIHVIDNFEIPSIPDSFLGLMGISNGVYLLNKFVMPKQGRDVEDHGSKGESEVPSVQQSTQN